MTPQREAEIREEIGYLIDDLLDCHYEQDEEGIDKINAKLTHLHKLLDPLSQWEGPPELI